MVGTIITATRVASNMANTKRSKRSPSVPSTRAKRKRSLDQVDIIATGQSRPKKKTASTVRSARSYRSRTNDGDKTADFSLLEHFRYNDIPLEQKLQASTETNAESSHSSEQQINGSSKAILKRKSLMSSKIEPIPPAQLTSATSTTLLAASSKNQEHSSRDIHPFPRRTRTGLKITGAALLNLLPPVLLSKSRETGCEGFTPAILRYIETQNGGMVDIFNRKTGRIMKGKDGVNIKDLAMALRNHSEYEPIVPTDPAKTQLNKQEQYRQARTSLHGRISADVLPQPTIRECNVRGRKVLITGGSHKGQFGKIEKVIPGNWYVITSVFNKDTLDLDVVVHSKDLNLVE